MFSIARKIGYSPLTGLDDAACCHDDEKGTQPASAEAGIPHRHQNFILIGMLFVMSNILCCLFGGYVGQKMHPFDIDQMCSKHVSSYSPILDEVGITYADTNFNGSFLQQTIYRQDASPAVDAAWEALGADYRPGVVSSSQGADAGLEERHVQRAEKYGGGYIVNVEGMHHLHCLNLVRKSLYFNFQYYKDLGTHAFENEEHILKLHITHCLDTVRQVLMCNVDTGLLGQVWFNPSKPTAFPDFNTKHKCKNFDAVREWAEQLQNPAPNQLPDDYVKPAEPQYILPATP